MFGGSLRCLRSPNEVRRYRVRLVAAALPVALLVAGCGADEEPGSPASGAGAEAEATLVDTDGLVAQHEFVLPPPDAEILPHLEAPVDERAVIIPGPDGVDARVVWVGAPCQTAPTVEVARDGGGPLVTIDRGPMVLGDADDCPSSEEFFAIDLVFADGVSIDEVEARIP
jgi:hypothetical protein